MAHMIGKLGMQLRLMAKFTISNNTLKLILAKSKLLWQWIRGDLIIFSVNNNLYHVYFLKVS